MPSLTEAKIRTAKPAHKPYKLFDGDGLFLLINPNGSRWWRFKYRFSGKERGISFGVYPDVSLKTARAKRDEARKLVAAGIDPSAERRAAKLSVGLTFEVVARELLAKQETSRPGSQRAALSPATVAKWRWLLTQHLFPAIGSKPIAEVTPPDLLAAVRPIEERGAHETAIRTLQLSGQVFRYAIATGRATRNPATDLRGALTPVVARNHPAITEPARVGELLRGIDGYVGQPATVGALKLAPLVFVRPGELRGAEWSEFDLDGKHPEWRIPATRMKMREAHIVPLADQAVAVLRELHTLTGYGRFVFPSLSSPARPMSENTINRALRGLGYAKDEMTGHGFRTLASTVLNELGWHPDVIELQLAHKERNKVRAAYNKAQRITERRKMMQAWADHLDGLRSDTNVVAIKRHA